MVRLSGNFSRQKVGPELILKVRLKIQEREEVELLFHSMDSEESLDYCMFACLFCF